MAVELPSMKLKFIPNEKAMPPYDPLELEGRPKIPRFRTWPSYAHILVVGIETYQGSDQAVFSPFWKFYTN